MYKLIEARPFPLYSEQMTETREDNFQPVEGYSGRTRQRFPKEAPYEPEHFAAKHGLTLKAARIILTANGPSRQRCDASARAFLDAVAARKEAKPTWEVNYTKTHPRRGEVPS